MSITSDQSENSSPNTDCNVYLCIHYFAAICEGSVTAHCGGSTIELLWVDALMLLSAACATCFQLRERSGNKTNYPVYIASVITA